MFLIKTKLIKFIFPTKYDSLQLITLDEWRKTAKPFFFKSRDDLGEFPISAKALEELKSDYAQIRKGFLQYFNNRWIQVGTPVNWHHNPDSNYEYPKQVHWAYIPDLSASLGDIKYVWEKSRFSYLYTIMRYDQHTKADSSAFVFELISSWIDQNPINQGPNYKCSQEISIRLLNWTYALYFYRNNSNVDEKTFSKILNSMRQQLIHVRKNIHFSRITVRNNHAITETLCLYLIGMLFPWFPEANRYKAVGKRYFEEEINYQIYPDGSYLQFSMNYHRVVVQLLTWAIELSKLNNEVLDKSVLERAKTTFNFLYNHLDDSTGRLPNYGANDGALFFKLNSEEFLNHAPQLNALSYVLSGNNIAHNPNLLEDAWWYSGGHLNLNSIHSHVRPTLFSAPIGGFYVMRQPEYFAMLRCGNHRDRPQQADQNQLDIWYKGKNIIRDNGSYKYNTDIETINYFSGTASHNTVQIGKYNQMLKGGRFIWYYWSQVHSVDIKTTQDTSVIDARAKVYSYLHKDIIHHRTVTQHNNLPKWEIQDEIDLKDFKTSELIKQIWHVSDDFSELGFEIKSFNKAGEQIKGKFLSGWNSPVYGEKLPSKIIIFEHNEPYFSTIITQIST